MLKYIYFLITTIPTLIVCQNFYEAWQFYESSILKGNREELSVINVTAKQVLSLKSNVTQWKSINIGPVCYSIGLADTGLEFSVSVLNENRSGFLTTTHFIPTTHQPKDVVMFHNRRNTKSECVVVISFINHNKLKWMSIVEKFVDKNFWSWTLDDQVEHINYFKMGGRNILFVGTNRNDALLYEFDINNSSPYKRWYLQSIHLPSPAALSTFNKFKSNYFLSILQPDQVIIYKYKYQHEKFSLHSKLQSLNVNYLTSFAIGFKSFLAINGYNASIYEFSENVTSRQNIKNSNLYGITFWLPVPIQTYRDEVILVVQRAVDHASHVNNEVDIFTYNGNKFEEHEDIPCFLFEENTSRLTCLTYNRGILDSTYIVIDDVVGLLIPRPDNTSIIFTVCYTMKQNPNPAEKNLHDLLLLKEKLQTLIENKAQMKEDLKIALSSTVNKENISIDENQNVIVGQPQNLSNYLDQLNRIGEEILKLSDRVEKRNKTESKQVFNSIIVNGKVTFEGNITADEVEVENINGQKTNGLLSDIVRRNNITGIIRNKTFIELVQVDNLYSSSINNVNSSDIVYNDDPVVILNGNITFKNTVLIQNVQLTSGNINNVDFEREAIIVGRKHEGNLTFNNINIRDNLRAAKINDVNLMKHPKIRSAPQEGTGFSTDIHIPHNATVTFINGINFTEFLHSICMINIKCSIPGTLKISDKIQASEITTNYLNDLKFPDEYVLKNSTLEVNITGRKYFKHLKSNKVAAGFVNNIDTRNVITTSTEQYLGNKTFKHFGITNKIKVDGKIVGNLVENFIPNLPLPDVDLIKANADFKNLEVNGKIFIENKFNHQDLNLLFQDLIYHDDMNATISGSKNFLKGFEAFALDIESGSIGNINISSIVTQDTDQQLNFQLLNGSVKIHQLFVDGKFGNVNLTELNTNVIKLEGDQFINTSLTFDDVEVGNLKIHKTLNNVSYDEYLFTTNGGHIEQRVAFDKIVVKNVTVTGNIIGNIRNLDLKHISENYVSRTKNQSFTFNMNLHESIVDSLLSRKINGTENKLVLNEKEFNDNLVKKINSGNITIRHLLALDSIKLKEVNNKTVYNILPLSLNEYLGRRNTSVLEIENDIYAPAIKINELSYVNWEDYVKQIVLKNETNVTFSCNKTFQNGITVEKLIEIKQLNSIPLNHILTKEDNQNIMGPIQIQGDVYLKDVAVKETINNISVAGLLKDLNISNGNYYLMRSVIFRRLPYIKSLKVYGKINEKNITEIFGDIAYKDKNITLINETIFKEPVFIAKNLTIKNNFNHVNFNDFISNIILTTSDADINSVVTFSKIVLVKEKLTVDEDLSALTIGGFNVTDWIDKSISVEKGLIKGHYTFENVYINNELTTDFVNDIDMKKLVPLRSNQSIDHMEFTDLKFVNDIPVGKTVNHIYLPEAVNKTLMKHIEQTVRPKTIFNIILVRKNLNTSLLNNKNTSKMVTTNTDQILTSNYNFKSKTTIHSNLQVDGLINEVNFDKWKANSLKIISKKHQLVCNNWTLENLTFFDNVRGINKINGLNLFQVSVDVEARKNRKLQFEHTILKDYDSICRDVTFLYEKSKSQIYKLKYFEEFQSFSFPNNIKMVYNFIYNTTHYLLVNKENCMTDIYMFNGTQFVPLFTNIPTDQFEQIVPVFDDENVLFLVARGSDQRKCDIQGTNIWIFNDEGLQLLFNMENQDLIQESLVPSTFYTIGKEGVTEYKVKKNLEDPLRYRKWEVFDVNAAFLPRGLKTGLAITTGKELIFLNRTEPIVEDIDTNVISEVVIKGSIKSVPNTYLPGRNGGDIVVLNVGVKSTTKNLLAVAKHEKTIVRDSMDFIKIYSDPFNGEVFDKVLTYRPSSLLSIEFGQGETLLAFLENRQILQIYEYKGIEGFERRISIKLKASKIFQMDLSFNKQIKSKKILGAIYKNKIKLLVAVMDGNQINNNLRCIL